MALTWTFCDGLLVLRITALYGTHTLFHYVVRTAFAVSYLILVVLNLVLSNLDFSLRTTDPVFLAQENFGCLGAGGASYEWALDGVSILTMAFQGVMLILTLLRVVPVWKQGKGSLGGILIRDGAMYFCLVFIPLMVLYVMSYTMTDRPGIVAVAMPWTVVLGPIGASRLYLSLKARRLTHEEVESCGVPESTTWSETDSTSSFQVPSFGRRGRPASAEADELRELEERAGDVRLGVSTPEAQKAL